MKTLLRRLFTEDSGQDLIEYALLAALIAVVSIAMIRSVGTAINAVFSTVNTDLTPAAGT
jgi:pilus assembly protein Flp/PilA